MKLNILRLFSAFLFCCGLFVLMLSISGIGNHVYAGNGVKNIKSLNEIQDASVERFVVVAKVTGAIGPATTDYIKRSISHAEAINAQALVLQMHTPGGLVTSMRDIIQDILASKVPIVTFVSPPGSHAASAGTYILYASHVAAMTPGTNIGAATPVSMTGKNPQITPKSPNVKDIKNKFSPPQERGDAVEYKSVNDAAAYIRGLAELRGRSVEWAEKAVRKAHSMTASEAIKEGVIEIIAEDIPDLMVQLDGRIVKMPDGDVMLQTKHAKVIYKEPNWRTRILSIITNPNVAFLLMSLGGYGLIYEFANPGTFVPGVIGVVCLIVGLFAMNILPVNYAGVVLIALGMGFMAAEAFLPSFGILGIGGAIAFALGGTILIDADAAGIGISWWTIGTVTGSSFLLLTVILGYALKAQRGPVTVGRKAMIDKEVEVLNWSNGCGEVRALGEIWQAVPEEPRSFREGDTVRVAKIDGLKLVISPVEKPVERNEEK